MYHVVPHVLIARMRLHVRIFLKKNLIKNNIISASSFFLFLQPLHASRYHRTTSHTTKLQIVTPEHHHDMNTVREHHHRLTLPSCPRSHAQTRCRNSQPPSPSYFKSGSPSLHRRLLPPQRSSQPPTPQYPPRSSPPPTIKPQSNPHACFPGYL